MVFQFHPVFLCGFWTPQFLLVQIKQFILLFNLPITATVNVDAFYQINILFINYHKYIHILLIIKVVKAFTFIVCWAAYL